MKVRAEIEQYSAEDDKPILLWLFERWHMSSNWPIMSHCSFIGRYPMSHRVWRPSSVGLALYNYHHGIPKPEEIE